MYSSFLYSDVTFTETQWNLAKIDESVDKTSYWQDTNVYISENKLAEDLKIGHYTEMYTSFFSWDVILLETEWNLEKIDESVNKTCKIYKKHHIDRIQTCISLKVN